MPGTIDEAFVDILPRVDVGDFDRKVRGAFREVEGQARRAGEGVETAFTRSANEAGRQLGQVDQQSRAAFGRVGSQARETGSDVETQFTRAGESAERSIREVGDSGRHLNRLDRDAKRVADRTEGHFRRAGSSIKSLFLSIGATLAGIGIARTFAGFIRGASGLNEVRNQINVTFGRGSQAQLQRFAATAATSMGLGQRAALDMVVQFGDLFRTTGAGAKEASRLSQRFVRLAGDLASFKNQRPEDVFEALRSGLIGEAEPLRRFGILLSEARVQQEALSLTGKKSAKDLTEQEKVQARYNLILRDSRRATGDYKNTADELANAQRTSQGLWQNLGDTIGTAFLPAAKDIFAVLNKQVLPAMISFAKQEGPGVSVAVSKMVKSFGSINFGDVFATIAEGARTFKANLDGAGISASGFIGLAAQLGDVARTAVAGIKDLGAGAAESSTGVSNLKSAGEGIGDTFSVASTIIGFFADHVELLANNMPLLIGAFIAYKAAQAAANAASLVQTALFPVQIFGTIALARANTRLALANRQLAGATAGTTASQLAQVGVMQVTTLAILRSAVAWVAQKAAMVAARAATAAYTAVQWLLNAALAANPIGLVIVAIALLVAGIVIAYQKSETFRKIVQGAFEKVKQVGGDMVGFLVRGFRFLLTVWLTVIGGILSGAASAFSWVPGVGPKLKRASDAFNVMKAKVLGTLQAIEDAAFGFGQSTSARYAAGVLSNLHKAKASALAVANTVRTVLRERSPAETGPLSEGGGTQGWGATAVELYARGMLSEVGRVGRVADRIAAATLPRVEPRVSAGLDARFARDQLHALGGGRQFHVENLNVQTIGDRFRLEDILTELRLQGVR